MLINILQIWKPCPSFLRFAKTTRWNLATSMVITNAISPLRLRISKICWFLVFSSVQTHEVFALHNLIDMSMSQNLLWRTILWCSRPCLAVETNKQEILRTRKQIHSNSIWKVLKRKLILGYKNTTNLSGFKSFEMHSICICMIILCWIRALWCKRQNEYQYTK